MVNEPHAPRGANKAKKPASVSTLNGEDTSFIVFGDGDKPSKKGKKQAASSSNDVSSTTSKSAKAPSDGVKAEVEKKPDTRTLIAGSSWTGKLPMTLFNEHCQKQHWEKPEYTTRRDAKGFTGGVIIRRKNAKTGEVTELPAVVPPKDYLKERGVQPSAVEARHFAAAYALFRVSNMKNIHMMLPPQYRDLWKGDFADLLSEAKQQGSGHLYEADPFAAKKQHEDAQVAKERARAEKLKQQEEDKKSQVVSLDGQVQSKHVLKGWQRVPKVEMGTKTRREVERLIRAQGVWNLHGHKLGQRERAEIVEHLVSIGFRKSHAQEAVEICKDREEALEWLLIHVPEEDLPKWALPDNYSVGVSIASSDLKREAKIQRLAIAGYASEVCAEILDAYDGDEHLAAHALQQRLLGSAATIPTDEDRDHDVWESEQETLSAIYGDRYTGNSGICKIILELRVPSGKQVALLARPPLRSYPMTPPILTVQADLPAYIRLSILKQCLLHATESLLGEQMVFSLLDWLEQEIPRIVDRPGRLSDIAGAASTFAEDSPEERRSAVRPRKHLQPLRWIPNSHKSREILSSWKSRQASAEQQRMLEARRHLPAWKLQDAIVASVTKKQVTIISGETGSGKSTQSVQFILDDLIKRGLGEDANIICTQPRRISALGLADRVADERCVAVGTEVGYAIRGESKQRPGSTKITFVTTGVLLRRLQTSGGNTEDVTNSLANVSHVVIDEVHERSLDTDFLLILMRDILKEREDLKLVLMSATLDAAVFERYFSASCSVGKVEIEGRTHPVHDFYLDEILMSTGFGNLRVEDDEGDSFSKAGSEPSTGPENIPQTHLKGLSNQLRAVGARINFELISRTVQWINEELGSADGAILIFLPGVGEIDQTLRTLRDVPGVYGLPLHASMQSSEQRRVFLRPPHGLRKIIAATNVAETSITIDDVVAVIDTGRVRETSFDPSNNMVKLAEVWASRAACKQRRGRAGRVRAGKCYKLYTKSAEAKMMERPEPEIRRVPLEQLCLSVKAMGVRNVSVFLSSAITPPESLAITGALEMLQRIGAVDADELTALGRHLSTIPADLRCGKLMVYGAAFGCLDACLTIAAILTVKSPFVSPQAKRDEAKIARAAFGESHGDLLCDLKAYREWHRRRSGGESVSSIRRWCDENFLHHQTLLDIATNKRQYIGSLQEIGFLTPSYDELSIANEQDPCNRHSDDAALVRALVAGAFQPQIARIDFPDKKFIASSSGAVEQDPDARTIKYFNEDNGRVFVHPSSTLFDAQSFAGNSVYMSYFSKMATSKVFIREITPFNVFSMLMFSGPIAIDPQGRGLLVDGWLRLRGWARIGVLVSRLRGVLDASLAKKVDDPSLDISTSGVVTAVKRLVDLDGLDH